MKRSKRKSFEYFQLMHEIRLIDKIKEIIADQGTDNDLTRALDLKRKYFDHKLRLLGYHGR